MSESFNLEIISPDKVVLKAAAEEVNIPSFEGQMTILKDHISLVTFLRPGFINAKINNKAEIFFVEEGTVEFSKNNLLILSSTVINVKSLTNSIKEKIIKESRSQLDKSEINDKERYILSYKIDSLQETNQ